jgi:hypothetical protein
VGGCELASLVLRRRSRKLARADAERKNTVGSCHWDAYTSADTDFFPNFL